MNNIYFVTGIGTDVGKTIATGLLARYLRNTGVKVITAKLVQTGNIGRSDDLERHRRIMGVTSFPEDQEGLTAPQIFRFPSSPHLAAKLENRSVDLTEIRNAVNTLAERYDVVLTEGAGGLAVPLTEDLLTIDFAAQENWPIILVVSGYLGSLNHALLSLEAISARKIKIAGTIFNYSPGEFGIICDDTKRVIQKYLKTFGQSETIISVPRVDMNNPHDLDFSEIFKIRSN